MLAHELGMTVEQLLSTISSAELAEWAAYYNLDKWKDRIRREEMTEEERMTLVRSKFSRVKHHGHR